MTLKYINWKRHCEEKPRNEQKIWILTGYWGNDGAYASYKIHEGLAWNDENGSWYVSCTVSIDSDIVCYYPETEENLDKKNVFAYWCDILEIPFPECIVGLNEQYEMQNKYTFQIEEINDHK